MATDCGIGTPEGYSGPCNGRYTAKDAGAGAFGGIDSAPVVGALVGAGAMLAAVLIALFLTHAVGGFFKERKRLARERRRQGKSPLFSEVVAEHLEEHPLSSRSGDANDLDAPDDVEIDVEDDSDAMADEREWDSDSPGAPGKFQ